MSQNKRQHYVQKAYLDGWADSSGEIYICDLTNGNIHKGHTKSAAWEKYYYCINDPDHPEKRFEIEEFLDEEVERPAIPVIRKLDSQKSLSRDEKSQLSLYIAFQKLRVPFFKKASDSQRKEFDKEYLLKILKDDQSFDEFLNHYSEKYKDSDTPPNREELIAAIEGDRIEMEYPRESSLKTMLLLSQPLSDIYTQSGWILLEATKSSFITSDNPTVTISMAKNGEIPVTETSFPLSPNSCLLIDQKSKEELVVTEEDSDGVNEINRRTLLHATRYIFSNDKELLRKSFQEYLDLKQLHEEIHSQSAKKPLKGREELFIRRIYEK